MFFSVINVLSGVTMFTCKSITTFSYASSVGNISHIYRRLSTNSTNFHNANLTVFQALSHWQQVFESNKIPEPRNSIQNILAHVLGHHQMTTLFYILRRKFNIRPSADIFAEDDIVLHSSVKYGIQVNIIHSELEKTLTPDQEKSLNSLCECRLARMPVQYIIKEWDFRDLRLTMSPPVFIPRPETEELIDLVVNEVPDCKHFLEVGCGTGAISLSLLKALSEAQSVAIDQSILACKLTLENAKAHQLQDRLDVLHCKLNDDGSLNGTLPIEQFDLLVSNPPYVPLRQILDLEPEIKVYEDLRALEAGKDGLRVIKALFVLAKKVLKPQGDIFLEVDTSHPALIKTLLEENPQYGLAFIKYYKDIYDRDRFVHLKKL